MNAKAIAGGTSIAKIIDKIPINPEIIKTEITPKRVGILGEAKVSIIK